MTAFIADFTLSDRNTAAFANEARIPLDQPQAVFTDITVDFFDVNFSGLSDFLGGRGGAGGKIVENLEVILVFFLQAGLADIPASRDRGVNPSAARAIGQLQLNVFWWGTVEALSFW